MVFIGFFEEFVSLDTNSLESVCGQLQVSLFDVVAICVALPSIHGFDLKFYYSVTQLSGLNPEAVCIVGRCVQAYIACLTVF